ncbi:hypothetical protein GX411_09475 [Candidatus Fermentibacteria bacterium]|nr:hypothetical protein [Candidatus Fermentibacteria bacterium]
MKASAHMAASITAGAALWLAGLPTAGAGLAVFGSLLDVDHIEHYAGRGMPSSLRGLAGAAFRSQRTLEKVYGFRRGVPASWAFPVLHEVEIAVLAVLLALLSGSRFLYGAFGGIMLHLAMDLRAYPSSPRFFSILWRRRNWPALRMAWKNWR